MTGIQAKLLGMLKWLTSYLDSNGLTYFVAGGTLLGALRHNGFIPWDDDVDIVMPREDYEKLVNIFKKDIGCYRLETPYQNNNDYLYTYSKLYDTSTTLVESQRNPIKRGVFIDIFPLDGLGNSLKEALKRFKRIHFKNMFLMTRTCVIRKERNFLKNLSIALMRMIPFFNAKKYSLKIDRIASREKYNECTFVCNFSGSYGKREIFEKRIWGTPKEHVFENIVVKIPEFSEELLTQLYHNWKQLPPVEKRGKQHDFLLIDLEKSYLNEVK